VGVGCKIWKKCEKNVGVGFRQSKILHIHVEKNVGWGQTPGRNLKKNVGVEGSEKFSFPLPATIKNGTALTNFILGQVLKILGCLHFSNYLLGTGFQDNVCVVFHELFNKFEMLLFMVSILCIYIISTTSKGPRPHFAIYHIFGERRWWW